MEDCLKDMALMENADNIHSLAGPPAMKRGPQTFVISQVRKVQSPQ